MHSLERKALHFDGTELGLWLEGAPLPYRQRLALHYTKKNVARESRGKIEECKTPTYHRLIIGSLLCVVAAV